MAPQVRILPFEALTLRDLYSVLELRCQVFVVEQKITVEPELDGRDHECAHVLVEANGGLVATARVFTAADPLVIGRVAVARSKRRAGLGSALMHALARHYEGRSLLVHARAELEPWYARLGFRAQGPVYLEAELPHVTMVRRGEDVSESGSSPAEPLAEGRS